jgi:D-3-phosphoglycerate dehydrogenase
MIGALGTILGSAGQNIADFRLGRKGPGETAICLVSLDAAIDDDLLGEVEALPQIRQVKRLVFENVSS